MRAWILLLAVLATFQPIVQVASTEDISSRFIKAISPRFIDSTTTTTTTTKTTTTTTTAPTTSSTTAVNPVIDIVTLTAEQQQHQHKNQHHQHHHQHQHNHQSKHHSQLHHHHHHQNQHKTTEEMVVDVTDQHQRQHSDIGDMDEAPTHNNNENIVKKAKLDPQVKIKFEKTFLSIFNMSDRPPKIDRSKIIIPDAMKQLYKQISGHDLDSPHIPKREGLLTKSANTVRSFTHQDSKIDDRFPHHHRFRMYFDIKSTPAHEKVTATELQLSRDPISQTAPNRTRYQVLVFDITRPGVRGKREGNFLLLDNKTIRLNSTDTISLDIQPAVSRWLDSPKKNYGLLVEVRTEGALKPAPHHHVRLRRSADEPEEVWQRKQPLLMVYTDDGKQKARSIRDASTRLKRDRRRRKKTDENCRRHDLYVDFGDVGWSDWIVAPNGYDAFYCKGNCNFPLAEHLNSTNHAVVQTLVNNINPGKVPKACCVPTQLEGISMLYLNAQNQVVLKNYQDMTALGCGCR